MDRVAAAALLVAQQLVVLDPYNDHYHQALLSLLDTVGDDHGVEGHYRKMRHDYADAQTPMDPYTRALMNQIRQRRRARTATDADPTGEPGILDDEPPADRPTSLVG